MEAGKYIVAIELGTSKIVGIVGVKNEDGRLDILATEKEDSAGCASSTSKIPPLKYRKSSKSWKTDFLSRSQKYMSVSADNRCTRSVIPFSGNWQRIRLSPI